MEGEPRRPGSTPGEGGARCCAPGQGGRELPRPERCEQGLLTSQGGTRERRTGRGPGGTPEPGTTVRKRPGLSCRQIRGWREPEKRREEAGKAGPAALLEAGSLPWQWTSRLPRKGQAGVRRSGLGLSRLRRGPRREHRHPGDQGPSLALAVQGGPRPGP